MTVETLLAFPLTPWARLAQFKMSQWRSLFEEAESLSILPVPSTTEDRGSSAKVTGKLVFFPDPLIEIALAWIPPR
jgi:hypothetical protein